MPCGPRAAPAAYESNEGIRSSTSNSIGIGIGTGGTSVSVSNSVSNLSKASHSGPFGVADAPTQRASYLSLPKKSKGR